MTFTLFPFPIHPRSSKSSTPTKRRSFFTSKKRGGKRKKKKKKGFHVERFLSSQGDAHEHEARSPSPPKQLHLFSSETNNTFSRRNLSVLRNIYRSAFRNVSNVLPQRRGRGARLFREDKSNRSPIGRESQGRRGIIARRCMRCETDLQPVLVGPRAK